MRKRKYNPNLDFKYWNWKFSYKFIFSKNSRFSHFLHENVLKHYLKKFCKNHIRNKRRYEYPISTQCQSVQEVFKKIFTHKWAQFWCPTSLLKKHLYISKIEKYNSLSRPNGPRHFHFTWLVFSLIDFLKWKNVKRL